MPITLNVGLSRKTSENYNSAGLSINITAELDQSLLARPHELQGAIHELYEQAEIALEQQSNAPSPTSVASESDGQSNGQYRPTRRDDQVSHGRSPAPHRSTSNPDRPGTNSRIPGAMTQSQRRAIEAIGKRLDLDVHAEASHEFGSPLEHMTVREASKMIDHLKSLQAAKNGGAH